MAGNAHSCTMPIHGCASCNENVNHCVTPATTSKTTHLAARGSANDATMAGRYAMLTPANSQKSLRLSSVSAPSPCRYAMPIHSRGRRNVTKPHNAPTRPAQEILVPRINDPRGGASCQPSPGVGENTLTGFWSARLALRQAYSQQRWAVKAYLRGLGV